MQRSESEPFDGNPGLPSKDQPGQGMLRWLHTNGGDIKKQSVLDDDLMRVIHQLILGLIELVYELPINKATMKAKLTEAAAILKK